MYYHVDLCLWRGGLSYFPAISLNFAGNDVPAF